MQFSLQDVPGRVFLDTCVVNFWLDHAEQIHDGVAFDDVSTRTRRDDIEAISGILQVGHRANWHLVVSPLTLHELAATREEERRAQLFKLFQEVWQSSRQYREDDVPSPREVARFNRELLPLGRLDVLPDANDRALLFDAIVSGCDAFCTRDWSTIIRHRRELKQLPLRIMRPVEWWNLIRPWASLWL